MVNYQKCGSKHTLSIEKRNSRERNRVIRINNAFQALRIKIPSIAYRSKRTSKVKILLRAMQYISELEFLLELDDCFK